MRELHFLYHQLRSAPTAYSYVVPTSLFAEHCLLFARIQNAAPDAGLLPVVTFDDGNASDLHEAAPVLDSHGLRAHFFVTAGWTGKRNGFMSVSELRSLHAVGHSIGAHGMTHKLLTQCTAKELDVELSGAKRLLEDALGQAVTTMSLPGGRANLRVLRACQQAGFHQVFTSRPEAVEMATCPALVGRLNLHGTTTVPWLEQVLDPRSGTLHKLQRADSAKAWAKQLLGDRLYARLWAFGNRHSGADGENFQGEAPAS